MYRYIKKHLLVLLILLMPSMNIASKALDTEEYKGTSSIHKRFTQEDQKTILSSAKPSAHSRLAQLNDLSTSLVSSVAAPVKRTFQVAREVMDFTVNNPKQAMFMGTVLALNCAAACSCYCFNSTLGQPVYEGPASDERFCCSNICLSIPGLDCWKCI